MSTIKKIRSQFKDLGIEPDEKQEIESLGLEVTICQFIVVGLSIMSIVFLFMPIFFLKRPEFILVFFLLSILSLGAGVWFWTKKSEICEHPEDYQ